MRVWFDADNSPHVLVMKPLAREMEKMGHEVFFTARDRSSTCGLLDLYGLHYVKVGGSSVRGMAGKILGTLARSLSLALVGRRGRPDLSFGHGSRALPIASALAGIPSVTMYDYEWVDPRIFNRFCRRILLPDAIGPARANEAGIDVSRVRFFPGLKEEIYLSDWEPGPGSVTLPGIPHGTEYVVVRPPATTAHYSTPLSESIYRALLESLLSRPGIRVVVVPRTGSDPVAARAAEKGAVIPERALDGPGLVWGARMVAGGGGTMTREASVLGVPSISFFRGRLGKIDEHLAAVGRLTILADEASASRLDPQDFHRSERLARREGIAGRLAGMILDAAADR
jgi:predicted glycosyltransferase